VTEHVGRLRERIHNRRDICELLLDPVTVFGVAALSAAPPIDCVEGEALGEERLDKAEAPAVTARSVD
jgi:hypothetical protein